ncbi:MAG TPA: DUF1924 domain-containing protein [Usitatibacter sp.]|jgi:hypothetical protein|nr:DUF1924 domain-containing protein [Usitatibacter sp.]
MTPLARGLLATAVLVLGSVRPAAAAPVDDLLHRYQSQGAGPFSAAAGEKFWDTPHVDAASGEPRKCALCHSTNLSATGKHAVTGKAIKPLAPSANPERLSDASKVEKWLERNCKWTLGRSCTPQEKGDVLVMIRSR